MGYHGCLLVPCSAFLRSSAHSGFRIVPLPTRIYTVRGYRVRCAFCYVSPPLRFSRGLPRFTAFCMVVCSVLPFTVYTRYVALGCDLCGLPLRSDVAVRYGALNSVSRCAAFLVLITYCTRLDCRFGCLPSSRFAVTFMRALHVELMLDLDCALLDCSGCSR